MRTYNIFTILFCFVLLTSCNRTLSFIVVSDLHFRGDSISYMKNKEVVEDMNLIDKNCHSNKLYNCVHPLFAWILGDLTDSGTAEQWIQYEKLYGLNGEGLLKYPVFECFGNHDGGVKGIVRSQIKVRNKKRYKTVYTDSLGLHYSWDIGNIHFVNLNLYPMNEWDSACDWCKYFKDSFKEAEYSLRFLEKDLKEHVGDTNRPVILGFHIGFDEFSLKWWTENSRNEFYDVIQDYNVIAIFHGHNHDFQKYSWRGIPVWSVGSSMHDDEVGEYLIVEVRCGGDISVKRILVCSSNK